MQISLPKLQVLERQVEKRLCEVSLPEFIKRAWPLVEPKPLVWGWHLDAICEHLMAVSAGFIRNFLCNIPPRFTKSLIVSVLWPTWEWTQRPELQYLNASYSHSLSVRDNVRSRRVLESGFYKGHWICGCPRGQVCSCGKWKLTGDQNTKIRYENINGGYRIATSVDGAATGEGGDRLIIDDPHNAVEADSETVRQATIDWYKESWSSRGNDPKTVSRVIIQQRVHHADLTGHILKEEKEDWCHLMIPMEYVSARRCYTVLGWEDPRTEEGELLCPERFPAAEVAELKRRMGPYNYAGQCQQNPTPDEGGEFKRTWWRYYVEDPIRLAKRADFVLFSLDCAFKDLKDSDYVAGGVIAIIGADKFLLDGFNEIMSFTETVGAVRQAKQKWPMIRAFLVEDKANGTAVIDTLNREIAGLIPIEPKGGKLARARAASPQVAAGNFWLQAEHHLTNILVEQAAQFPKGDYDDLVDMLSQAVIWIEDHEDWKPKISLGTVYPNGNGASVTAQKVVRALGVAPLPRPRRR